MKNPSDLVRDEVLALSAYHVSPARGMVKLDAMENPYRLPAALAEALGRRLAEVPVNRYPDPAAPGLKARLREAMGIPGSLEIMVGNGSDEILQIVTLALARPGAAVLCVEPSFVVYRMAALAAGMRCVGVPLKADFTLDEAALIAAVERERPALTWIAYPNNPTGNLFARDAILRVVAASPGLVAVDEAYYAFSGASMLSEVGKHPNLILVRTVSKLGLAGLRLGLAIGAREWLHEFEKLRMPYNVGSLNAAAGEFLLGEARAELERQTASIVAERSRLEAALDALPGVIRFPSAANFILVRVPDGPRAFEALRERGILVRTFHGSHPLLAHSLRLTVGTPDENTRMLEALTTALG